MNVQYGTLRLRRIEMGFSQARLAEIIGVNRATINRWEAGTHVPLAPQFFAWSRALKTNPNKMMK